MIDTYKEQHMLMASRKQDKESSEALLEQFDKYIITQSKRIVRLYPPLGHQAVIDLEIDELIQRVRIKLWRTLQKREIFYPYNYIKRMIRNEIIDMQRQQKPTLPLPIDEEEQWYFTETTGCTLADTHEPADEVEQQMESSALLQKTVPLVLRLPPRQRLAMMCSLKDRVDDLVQLVESFKGHQTDIEKLSWPEEQQKKRVLQASLIVARRSLVKHLGEEVDEH